MTKRLMLWLGISLVCFTAFVLSARATEKETVSLANVNGQVEATLELPEMPTEEIVALQLSFQIEAGQGGIRKEDISFAFDAGLPAGALQQSRYQEDTGILTIYISGNQDLYPKGDSASDKDLKISLGRVVVNSDKNASVKVVKNSFKTVNKAHGMYEGEVNTGDGGQTINNGSTDGVTDNDQKPGEVENSFGSSGEISGQNDEEGSGTSGKDVLLDREQKEQEKRSDGSASITGVLKKFMDAPWNQEQKDDLSMPEAEKETQAPSFPEDSLWEEGAKLWKEKILAMDMDVWAKIFCGLFVVSASVAVVIGCGLMVQASKRRKRRKKRKTLSKPQAEKVPIKSEAARRRTKTGDVRKKQATRRTQSKASYREQPVWKDNKKSYVRKRRKIS